MKLNRMLYKNKIALTLMLLLCSGSMQLALAGKASGIENNKFNTIEIERIKSRVFQIKQMDKNNMSKSEKTIIKTELIELKNKLVNEPSNGVYLSLSGLIILILLLVVLF